MLVTSWERPGGELVRFDSRMKMGDSDMVSQGRVEGDKLVIETTTLGKTQAQTIPWPDWRRRFLCRRAVARRRAR